MPRCDCSPECTCRDPAAQERQNVEPRFRACRHALSGSGHAGSQGTERSGPILKVFGLRIVAATDWVPPPEPRRNEPSRDHAWHNPAGQRIHCVKLLGQRLSARDFERQVAEIQIRAAIFNEFTALGIPETVTVGEVRQG